MAILNKNSLLGTVAVAALLAGATGALAGGFAIREQSTSAQGASFAGNAANSDLSAMFWNPAGAANVQGFGTESHYTLIIPRAHIDVTGTSHDTSTPQGVGLNALMNSGKFANNSGDIGKIAALGATYLAYQFVNYDPNLFLGLAMNSPFGLKTKPEDVNYKGSVLGRETSLLTLNVSPSLAYKITPNLVVSAGAQMQYADATLTFGGTPSAFDTRFEGTGLAFGGTAGVMWTPAAGTTVGLGYRSQLKQQLSGSYSNNQGIGALGVPPALGGFASVEARTNLNLPDIVSLSLRQSIAPNARILGTVEWSNWSRFQNISLRADGTSTVLVGNGTVGAVQPTVTPGTSLAVIPANWSDGWLFALGAEYDFNQTLTGRFGGGYEISPVDAPTKRLIGIPDNDRIWASAGATYKWSSMTSFDLAYTHVFVKDSQINRTSVSGYNILGNVDASTDIVSVSMKMRW